MNKGRELPLFSNSQCVLGSLMFIKQLVHDMFLVAMSDLQNTHDTLTFYTCVSEYDLKLTMNVPPLIQIKHAWQ